MIVDEKMDRFWDLGIFGMAWHGTALHRWRFEGCDYVM